VTLRAVKKQTMPQTLPGLEVFSSLTPDALAKRTKSSRFMETKKAAEYIESVSRLSIGPCRNATLVTNEGR
jgi:hypothetical protein